MFNHLKKFGNTKHPWLKFGLSMGLGQFIAYGLWKWNQKSQYNGFSKKDILMDHGIAIELGKVEQIQIRHVVRWLDDHQSLILYDPKGPDNVEIMFSTILTFHNHIVYIAVNKHGWVRTTELSQVILPFMKPELELSMETRDLLEKAINSYLEQSKSNARIA